MNKYHREILEEIRKRAKKPKRGGAGLGHRHLYYGLSNPVRRMVLRQWAKARQEISFSEFLNILNDLSGAESYEEKTTVGMLLEYFPRLRAQVSPELVDKLLSGREGWAEVDSICQNVFKPAEMLVNWTEWEKWLRKWARNTDVHKRRASLVLLTGPVVYSPDKRLSDLAFANIERLKGEKDILITKAVSWLLRSLVRSQPALVQKYLNENEATLPRIAVRETRNKLKSGRKSGH